MPRSDYVITDFGYSPVMVDTTTGEETRLGRYGVWGYKGHHSGKHEVLACGDDLDALQAKYGPDLPVEFLGPKE